MALKQAMSPDFVVYQKQVLANAKVRDHFRVNFTEVKVLLAPVL